MASAGVKDAPDTASLFIGRVSLELQAACAAVSVRTDAAILFTGHPLQGKQFRIGGTAHGRNWMRRMAEVRRMPDGADRPGAALTAGLFPAMGLPFLGDLETARCLEEQAGGRSVWIVVEAGRLPIRRMEFDRESGLLCGLESARHGDYRSVGDLRLPFEIRFARSTFQISGIRFNPPRDATMLEAPEAVASAGKAQYRTRLSAQGRLDIANRPASPAAGKGAACVPG